MVSELNQSITNSLLCYYAFEMIAKMIGLAFSTQFQTKKIQTEFKHRRFPSKMQQFPRSSISNRSQFVNKSLNQTIQEAQALLTDEDYFQKAFLKPIEVALKTDKPGLPKGLSLVLKDDISGNKFKTTSFDTPNIKDWDNMTYQQMIERNYDNLFSLIKSADGIELAICVCMYSEDKKMLKNTLAGISENIDLFVKGGLSTDKIAVVVVMDGIEKVDSTITQYFDELERESSIIFCQENSPLGLHDLLLNNTEAQQKYEDEVTNINKILFTEAELFERQEKRFSSRVKEYKKIRDLMDLVDRLKYQKGITYDILDPRIQDFFIEVARERRQEQYGEEEDQMMQKDKQFFIEQYAHDVIKSRPIIMQALILAKQYCEEYIKSRETLSLVNYFRTSVFIKATEADLDQKGEQINASDENQEDSRISSTRMNLFLCTKYKNSGKLSSHNWFFNGFCKELNPQYAVLLDVGLRPQKNALYKMFQYMKIHQNVGGVCGYMGLKMERVQDELGYNQQLNQQQDIDCISRFVLKFVDIQRAQQMQYHFAHLIDKPFESQFNFIHVLPGAFSAYNMKALQANNLLQEYFKSLEDKLDNSTIVPSRYTAYQLMMKTVLPDAIFYTIWPIDQKSEEQYLYNENIYLAEDRILCMGIHTNGKDMAFLPDAYAWVDSIKNVHTLLGQRKRWINGSFFAFDKVKNQLSKRNVFQPALRFQMYYLSFMNMMAYVAPALFLFTVSIAIQVFRNDVLMVYFNGFVPTQILEGFTYVINFVYVMMTAAVIFFSMHLTNRHKKFIPLIYASAIMLGIFALIVFWILIVDILRGDSSFLTSNLAFIQSLPFSTGLLNSMRWIIIAIIMLYAVPVIVYVLLYKRFSFAVDTVFGALSFLFFSPTYLNILNIYALCRINDISWGTKGLDQDTSSKNEGLQQTWSVIRLLHVGKYLFWNIIAGMILLTLGGEYVSRFLVTFIIMLLLGFTLFIKVAIGTYYIVNYYLYYRIQDPPEDSQYNQASQVNDFYSIIKPQIVINVQNHIQNSYEEIELEKKMNGPKSVVTWGGRSKVLAPGKKKENLKKGFQVLQKLNASRIIRKDAPDPSSEFKGRYKLAQDKTKYKRKRDLDLSEDGMNSQDIPSMKRPANSKDKYKKYRGVVQIRGSVSIVDDMSDKPVDSKDKYRRQPKPFEEQAIGESDEFRPKTMSAKDKYKKGGKREM